MSDGVAAVRAVLVTAPGLTSLVPAERIVAGVLPQGITLPAIGLLSISRVDRPTLAREDHSHVRERVQVRVAAATYPDQKRVLRAVRKAADFQLDPEVEGISDITILADGAGPDIYDDETSIHLGTQDFGVSYNEER